MCYQKLIQVIQHELLTSFFLLLLFLAELPGRTSSLAYWMSPSRWRACLWIWMENSEGSICMCLSRSHYTKPSSHYRSSASWRPRAFWYLKHVVFLCIPQSLQNIGLLYSVTQMMRWLSWYVNIFTNKKIRRQCNKSHQVDTNQDDKIRWQKSNNFDPGSCADDQVRQSPEGP